MKWWTMTDDSGHGYDDISFLPTFKAVRGATRVIERTMSQK